jgi:hypothetical protein
MNALGLLARLLVAALLGVAHHPAVAKRPVPTPIGRGPGYQLRTGERADRGEPIGRLRCDPASGSWADVHVEVFALGRVVILPPGIGIATPRRRVGAVVRSGRCAYPVRTTDPTGVVAYRPGRGLRLADVFAVWGQPLSAHRLLGFRSAAPVRAYVDGRLVPGPPGAVPLRRHAEIVVELGAYVPPHASYLFADGREATG